MKLTPEEKNWAESNEKMIILLINKRLEDCNFASINEVTIDDREKARLVALEYQALLTTMAGFKKKPKNKKDFSGI